MDSDTLRYTITSCSLGRLLLAATAQGICAVSIGESDAKLLSWLHKKYDRAEIHRDDVGLADLASGVLAMIAGNRPSRPLPIDVPATTFQRRVWQALQAIPAGETRTYQQVARAIGKPRAARAVGQACGANPVAIVVPCHRVVRSDGGMGGFGLGIARKKALLEAEQ